MKNKILLLILLLCGTTQSFAGEPKAKHLVLIGLDGWGSYSVEQANMPVTKHLMNEGGHTLKKRAVLPSSSAVNWASMFMGAGPEVHGYTEWGSKTPELPSRVLGRNNIFPTVFQLYREVAPEAEIGCFYEWPGIKYLVDTLSLSHHALAPDYTNNPTLLCDLSVKYIADKKPQLLAVIFDNPDHVGHKQGHNTAAYYAKLEELDSYIGRIVEAVKDAGMWEDTIFIITSDHGGINKGHGGKTLEEVETPFIISGKNVRKGVCLDHISMMQYDCASVIAEILGFQQPQVWTGRAVDGFFY